uniref:NADH dehydrogenase subunit 5 n=1 Tax=Lingula reevii TaxID=2792136 RepID=UPI002E7A6F32|nr:NADH dehydrogenase subunit 5 [Lingula reevii]WQG15356.1 NADH dehydrogenase subunit 5 [Lingula reevii]
MIFMMILSASLLGGLPTGWLNLSMGSLGSSPITLSLVINSYSLMFSAFVGLISVSVMLFSADYMALESFKPRFYYLVGFFVLSMISLIFMPHFPGAMLGWDCLGMSSFLLVSYYKSGKASKGASLTALSSRVGDMVLVVFMCISLSGISFSSPSSLSGMSMTFLVSVLLVVGGFSKSAQTPFSSWLPAAMAAPTPVSALVHSSTLVTAGVYLVIQNYSILNLAGPCMLVVGGLSTVIPSLLALWECDLKRIVALSTLSQLGFMFLCLGCGLKDLAFIHLLTHAVVKALLFICVGVLINHSGHAQDIHFLGGSLSQLPVVAAGLLFSLAGLVGAPFFGAYYSKHMIESNIAAYGLGWMGLGLFYLSVALTVAYSVRILVTSALTSGANFTHRAWGKKKSYWYSYVAIGLLCFALMGVIPLTCPLLGVIVGISNLDSGMLMESMFMAGCLVGVIFPSLTTGGPDLLLDEPLDCVKEEAGEKSKEVLEFCESGWLEYWGIMGAYNVFLINFWWVEKMAQSKASSFPELVAEKTEARLGPAFKALKKVFG